MEDHISVDARVEFLQNLHKMNINLFSLVAFYKHCRPKYSCYQTVSSRQPRREENLLLNNKPHLNQTTAAMISDYGACCLQSRLHLIIAPDLFHVRRDMVRGAWLALRLPTPQFGLGFFSDVLNARRIKVHDQTVYFIL